MQLEGLSGGAGFAERETQRSPGCGRDGGEKEQTENCKSWESVRCGGKIEEKKVVLRLLLQWSSSQ